MGVFMTLEQTLTVVGSEPAVESVEPYSVAWWESRTAEDLRDIINRGFAGGPVFKAANAEIERRARAETRRLREQAATEALARQNRKKVIWGIAASVVAIAVLLGFWLAR
jgi:hypothetical protein